MDFSVPSCDGVALQSSTVGLSRFRKENIGGPTPILDMDEHILMNNGKGTDYDESDESTESTEASTTEKNPFGTNLADESCSEKGPSASITSELNRKIEHSEVHTRSGSSKSKKASARKLGGLSLPDVVRELLKEVDVLRWDPIDRLYEVLNGEKFETRFNELRRVRNKDTRGSGTERPFSRMHNFFALEMGDKWARTGTKFRPLNSRGFPPANFMKQNSASEADNIRGIETLRNKSYPLLSCPPSTSSVQNVGVGGSAGFSSKLPLQSHTTVGFSPSSPHLHAASIRTPLDQAKAVEFIHDRTRVPPHQASPFRGPQPGAFLNAPPHSHILGKRSHHFFESEECDEDSTSEDEVELKGRFASGALRDGDIIPSHLIDAVASRLLFKRPCTSDLREAGSAFPERTPTHVDNGFDCAQRGGSEFHYLSEQKFAAGDGTLEVRGLRASPQASPHSSSTPLRDAFPPRTSAPDPLIDHSRSALPLWLLAEAEADAAAVAAAASHLRVDGRGDACASSSIYAASAAAADRRLLRYVSLLGEGRGHAPAVPRQGSWLDLNVGFDCTATAVDVERWDADLATKGVSPASDSANQSAGKWFDGVAAFSAVKAGNSHGGMRVSSGRAFPIPRDSDFAFDSKPHPPRAGLLSARGRAPSWSDGDEDVGVVYEISSEGGSCRPSPEGPVISLMGDLGAEDCCASDGPGLSPLDLGGPALDPASTPAAHTMAHTLASAMAPVSPRPPPSAATAIREFNERFDCYFPVPTDLPNPGACDGSARADHFHPRHPEARAAGENPHTPTPSAAVPSWLGGPFEHEAADDCLADLACEMGAIGGGGCGKGDVHCGGWSRAGGDGLHLAVCEGLLELECDTPPPWDGLSVGGGGHGHGHDTWW